MDELSDEEVLTRLHNWIDASDAEMRQALWHAAEQVAADTRTANRQIRRSIRRAVDED